MKIAHTDRGYTVYCFRCNYTDIEQHGMRSISQLVLSKGIAEYKAMPLQLPKDFTTEIPEKHTIWLYKAGIFKDTALRYGIGWSNSTQRVILPVYKDDKLVYMQARAVILRHEPKYLNKQGASRAAILFESYRSKHWLCPSNTVVITEDILSAIRTGVYVRSFSTLGTKLTDAAAYKLSEYKCIVWYDNDKAGWLGAVKVKKKLESLGTTCLIYDGRQDPKYYDNSELINILGGLIGN